MDRYGDYDNHRSEVRERDPRDGRGQYYQGEVQDRIPRNRPEGESRTPVGTYYNGAYDHDRVREDRPGRGIIDNRPVEDTSQSNYNNYFLPGEGINREVIQVDICRYLGADARVRPFRHSDGRQGYLITAYRGLTTPMINSLKDDSRRYEAEQRRRIRSGYPQANYPASSTFDERNQIGPALPRMAQYTGAQMDIDEYDDGRRPYNTGQPGYPSGIGRQGSLPVSSTYSPDPSFPAYHIQRIPGLYDSNSDPRTTTNTTLPPVSMPVSMSGQSPFGGYSVQPTAQGRYHDI